MQLPDTASPEDGDDAADILAMLDRDGLLPHIRNRYSSDPLFSTIMQDLSTSYCNFVVCDGYVFLGPTGGRCCAFLISLLMGDLFENS